MAALWWSVSGCLYLWCAQKPCRRLALISCASCSSVLGEAVAPGRGRLLQVFINKQHFNKHVRALSRVVSSRNAEAVRHTGGGGACCGRQKARSFTEQAGFFFFFFYPFKSIRGTVGAKDSVRMHMSTEHVTEHLLMPVQLYFWASFHFIHVVVNLVSVRCLATLLQLPPWRHCLCYCPMLYKTELVFKAWKMFAVQCGCEFLAQMEPHIPQMTRRHLLLLNYTIL